MIKRETGLLAVFVAAGISIALAGASFAGQDQTMNQNGNMSNNMNGGMSGNMNGNMKGGMKRSTGMTGTDAKFAMEAAMGGMAEVEAGRVALQRSSSDSVKQFAQQMIDDHTKANAELMELATSKGMTLPTTLDAKHMAMMSKMQAMSGAEFDRAYIKQSGVKDHQKNLKVHQREAANGKDADLKAYAARNTPIVQGHLSMAQQMATSMMGMKMSGGNMSGNMNGSMSGNMNSNMGKRRKGSNMNANMGGNMNANSNMGGGNINSNLSR